MNCKSQPSYSPSQLLDRFARVYGSGIFHLDDFCALTGCPPNSAVRSLEIAENTTGRVVALAPTAYLLKPVPIPNKALWYDWEFNRSIQRIIFDACGVAPQSKPDIMRLTGLADTTISRYLRAMLRSGNLTSSRRGTLKYYSSGFFKPLTSYRNELCSKGA